ncbi:hypothetical protein C8R45DRAFT_971769, partial [Mycena sanguinolenta]
EKRNPPCRCFKTRCLRRKALQLQLESTRLVVMRMACGRKMRQHPAGAPTFPWTVRTCSWLGWRSSVEEVAAKGKSPGQRGQRSCRERTDGAVVLEDKPRVVVLVVLGLGFGRVFVRNVAMLVMWYCARCASRSQVVMMEEVALEIHIHPARPRTPLTSRYAENCARQRDALESRVAHRKWRKVVVCMKKCASCDACRVQARERGSRAARKGK